MIQLLDFISEFRLNSSSDNISYQILSLNQFNKKEYFQIQQSQDKKRSINSNKSMRPSSAYGRGPKITAATSENFYNSKAAQQKSSNNPILAGRGILSNEQIEYQLNACKQNDIELVKAQMNLKLDVNQKRSEESKKIIISGYEEQYKLLNEMNEKKMQTLKMEQEKFIEKLLNKQKQEIKELESSYESKIKSIKVQLDDAQRDIIRQQEEMMDKLSKEREKLESKHSKKIEELKQKQKNKFTTKIEKLKQEWLEEQEDDRAKAKKEAEKKVQQEINEMREQLSALNEQLSEQKMLLIQKNKETSDLYLQLRDIEEQNEQLQKKLKQSLNTNQKQSSQIKQKQLNQLQSDNTKKFTSIEERNEDQDDNTDYESLNGEDYLKQQGNSDDDNEFIERNIQQDVSVPYNLKNNHSTHEEQEYMDLQQLQSDIKQSIQYQINLLHSKSQQNSNQSSQSNQLNTFGAATLGAERNNIQNALENISLRVDKNESIKIQSKDLFQVTEKQHFLSDSDKKLDNFENLSLNNSQDFVMEGNESILAEAQNDNSAKAALADKATNTDIKQVEETAQRERQFAKMKSEIEQQRLHIQEHKIELENLKVSLYGEFNDKLKSYIQIIQDKQKKQNSIIKTYQSEIQRLVAKIQNITDVINEAELLPNLQIGSQNLQNPPIHQQQQSLQQQSHQATQNQGGKLKSNENKTDQKKNEVKSPAFVIHQKQNTSSQKAQIIVRSSIKSLNPLEQRSTQQIQNKQSKI